MDPIGPPFWVVGIVSFLSASLVVLFFALEGHPGTAIGFLVYFLALFMYTVVCQRSDVGSRAQEHNEYRRDDTHG